MEKEEMFTRVSALTGVPKDEIERIYLALVAVLLAEMGDVIGSEDRLYRAMTQS